MEAGILHEWSGHTNISFAEALFKSDISGTGYEIAAGLMARLNRRIHLYSDVTFEDGHVYTAVTGNIGLRFNF